MAKVKVVGIESFVRDLSDLTKDCDGIMKAAVYDGAGVIADAVKANINALPTRKNHYVPEGKRARGATPYEKEALRRNFGIAKMRVGDGVDTVIGFDGYDGMPTKKWPSGHPVSMVARSIESGTSWLQKTPFVNKAVASSKAAAEAAMQARFESELKKRGF